MRRISQGLIGILLLAILAGCEGSQVVQAPAKRPEGMGMARGTTAPKPGDPPTAANK